MQWMVSEYIVLVQHTSPTGSLQRAGVQEEGVSDKRDICIGTEILDPSVCGGVCLASGDFRKAVYPFSLAWNSQGD